MGERTRYEPGTFCWVDVATPDATGAKAFYGSLFGWSMHDVPGRRGTTYTRARLGGADVAGGFGGAPPPGAAQTSLGRGGGQEGRRRGGEVAAARRRAGARRGGGGRAPPARAAPEPRLPRPRQSR